MRTFSLIATAAAGLAVSLFSHGQDAAGQVNGCICVVDQAKAIIRVVPWDEANTQWVDAAPQSFLITDTTQISSNNKVTVAEVKRGRPVDEDVKDLAGLVGQRATIRWTRNKDRERVIDAMQLILIFKGESAAGYASPDGKIREITTCPCK